MNAAARAEAALSDPRAMCALLAQCRQYRVPGWWDGSAYRSHPVGLIVDAIKLTNHWHVDQLCDIHITDGRGWNRNVCQDSFAHSIPHPKPIDGAVVQVWRCGQWLSAEFERTLKPKLLEILTAAADHIEGVAAAQKAADEAKAEQARAAREATISAALLNATEAKA